MTIARTGLRAVFLAAGFGTRMYPLTRDKAKPLLKVGGEPLLTRLVRQVGECGEVTDGVVVVNARFHDDFVEWREGLGTGLPLTLVNDRVTDDRAPLGAIADLALALREATPREVGGHVVVAGDNLFDFDLRPFLLRFLDRGRGQLLLRRIPRPVPPRRYNEVALDEGGRVVSFREKPDEPGTDLAAIAVYFLPAELPSLIDEYLATGAKRDAPGYLMEWLHRRIPMEGSFFDGAWFDIGNRESFAQARVAFG